jgi:hypothetical protein
MYLVFGLSEGKWNLAIDQIRAKVPGELLIRAVKWPLERVFGAGTSLEPLNTSF